MDRRLLLAISLFLSMGVQAQNPVGLFDELAKPVAPALKLKIASFNIRFYGSGGTLGAPGNEPRDPDLRAFVADYLGDRDVIAFQEIVDVPRLQQNVLPPNWSCVSYEHSDHTHQHVVVCAKPGLSLERDPSDDNFIMENVAYSYQRSRPAVHTIVKTSGGQALARVIAVHLKASPDFSRERQSQITTIGQNLIDLNNVLPTVITGDFNTYDTPANGLESGDEALFSGILGRMQSGMAQIPNTLYTYRTRRYLSRFDHFWTKGFNQERALKVFSMCNNQRGAGGNTLEDPDYYYEHISDHCPVSVDLEQTNAQLSLNSWLAMD